MNYKLEIIARNIKLLRSKRHWKVIYVANNTGIEENRLRRIEVAEAIPKHHELYALSRLYGVSIDDLVFKELEWRCPRRTPFLDT